MAHVKGRVIALPQLGATESLILEFTGKTIPQGGQPLAGAWVTVIYDLDYGRPAPGGSPIEEVGTDEQGYFELRGYDAPYRDAQLGLKVTKAGYKDVFMPYTDFSKIEPQSFLVILVPSSPADNGIQPAAK